MIWSCTTCVYIEVIEKKFFFETSKNIIVNGSNFSILYGPCLSKFNDQMINFSSFSEQGHIYELCYLRLFQDCGKGWIIAKTLEKTVGSVMDLNISKFSRDHIFVFSNKCILHVIFDVFFGNHVIQIFTCIFKHIVVFDDMLGGGL